MTQAIGKPSKIITICVFATLALALLSGCDRPLPTYRYKLTVEVETPSGLKHGSSVIEVRSTDKGRGFPGPEAGGIDSSVIGEAVPIELSNGVIVFALLERPFDYDYAAGVMTTLNKDIRGRLSYSEFLTRLKQRREALSVPREIDNPNPAKPPIANWPMMVTFRNRSDPSSVIEVDPEKPQAILGRGVRIKNITAQVTNDAVDHKIANYLPWINTKGSSYLNGASSERVQDSSVAAHLTRSSFVRQ